MHDHTQIKNIYIIYTTSGFSCIWGSLIIMYVGSPQIIYCIAQNFRWIKISLNAHALYWHKNFTEFNFAHSASCSPGSSGWSSRMNTPRPNIWYCIRTRAIRSISLYVPHFLLPLVFACCTPFTAALASAMAEGDSSADRGPEGSGKPEEQRGSRIVTTSS